MSLITLPNNQGRVAAFEMIQSQSTIETLAGVTQITSFPDRRWSLRIEVVQQKGSNLREWMLAMTRLSDRANWFAYGPPHYSGPSSGYAGTSPVVKGDDQLGVALDVDGVTNNATILLPGDFISFDVTSAKGNTNRQLIQVTNTVTADGSGNATIQLATPIRQAPADNAAVNIVTPSAFFMLTAARGGMPSYTPKRSSEFVIDAVERVFP